MSGNPPSQDGAPLPRAHRRPRLRWCILAILAVACFAIVGALGLEAAAAVSQVEVALDAARPWLWTGQLCATAVAWIRWPRIVRWLARTGRIRSSAIEPLLHARHRALALVLLLQVTAGIGLPISLLNSAPGR